MIRARWPDGFVALFPAGSELLDEHELAVEVAEDIRRRAQLDPLALWCDWQWST